MFKCSRVYLYFSDSTLVVFVIQILQKSSCDAALAIELNSKNILCKFMFVACEYHLTRFNVHSDFLVISILDRFIHKVLRVGQKPVMHVELHNTNELRLPN